MKLIVGLGNPGDIYQDSRHNIGFSVIKALAKTRKAALKKEKGILALSARVKIDSFDVILAIPLTYMNLSGGALKLLLKKYRVQNSDLLIVLDELDLDFGRMKLKSSGTSAGHRGLQSVIDSLSTQDLNRLRIGIGRPHRGTETSEYVLSPFSRQEKEEVKEIITQALLCCQSWVSKGMDETMNMYNRRSKNEQ